MSSVRILHSRSLSIQILSAAALCPLLLAPSGAQNGTYTTSTTSPNIHYLPPVTATQSPTATHSADLRTGPNVSSGMSNGEKAGIIGGIAAGAALTALLVHHYQHKQPSADDLSTKGPQVAPNASMSHLIVDGLIGPNWPVGLDFQLEGPGSVILDITTAEKVQYHQVLTNNLHGRGITVTHPGGLPDKLQPATFDVETVAPNGSNAPPPAVRIYGLAAGPNAVHSIAIDQITFGPAQVKIKQDAQYGFHSHTDFSNVCADLMFTGLKDNHIVMMRDYEKPLSPVSRDERPQGSLQTKGNVGQHLLQIRAWRGNSGDWVVAWSPDVVTLTK